MAGCVGDLEDFWEIENSNKFVGMIQWFTKSFEELTNKELYAIMQIRFNVFIIEQNCMAEDLDDYDQKALHLFGVDEGGKVVAYARIFGPGKKYDEAAFGRVLTAKELRGQGAGKELMKRTLEVIEEHYGKVPVKISAQSYLLKFYSELGFEQVSEEYDDHGLPHIDMLRPV